MMRNVWILACVLAIPAAGHSPVAAADQEDAAKLNIIFFHADDLGGRDLGCYGSAFYESPNLDRLCAEGLKFTQAYTAGTVCSPTRASIITGRYPVRTGCTNFGWSIRGTERGVAQDFSAAGYATFFVGKWHVGGVTPEQMGFAQGGEVGPAADDPKGTRTITRETVSFLKSVQDKPFFAFVNYHAVHTPLRERPEVVEKYAEKLKTDPPVSAGPRGLEQEHGTPNKQVQDDPRFAAMLEVMDQSVGEILEAVREIGADRNTVVVFSSDNGGLSTKPCTSNLPLRAGKGWVYEGGIRVPLIIKWPGVIRGGSVTDAPVISTDYYPTFLEMAGLPLRPDDHLDGLSYLDLLTSGKAPDREALYWHYPHDHGSGSRPSGAIRSGDYKLVWFFGDHRQELYNLKDDLSELHDLSASMPGKKTKLLNMLKSWQKTFPDISFEHTDRPR